MSEAGTQRYRGIFSKPRTMLAVTGVAAAGLWMLCVGSTSTHEIAVGVVVLLLTIPFCSLLFRNATLPFEPTWRDVAEARRLPGNLIEDCLIVLRVLARDLTGRPPAASLYTAPFAASVRDPERIGRTVLAATYMTMTPNSIVIGTDPSRSLILYHQLERTPTPTLVKTLGAPR